MKNKVITMALFCLLLLTLNVNATSLSTNAYTITPMEKPSSDINATKAWLLKFDQKDDIKVTIQMIPTKAGVEYVVYTNYFEISYANGKNGFGAKTVKNAFSKVSENLTNMTLDPDKISNQRILTQSQVTESEALGLIASYLPLLLKDQYMHLLN